MAILEKPAQDVHAPITPEEARKALRVGKWTDASALNLVIQDCLRAENFESTKMWVMQWPTATTLYQSPFTARYWEGTQTERANVPFYTVATAVNSLVPQVLNGLFYENPPFMIQERPGTRSQAARAIGALLGYQLEDINFREELRLGCTNCVLFGTGLFKWGWETYTRDRKIYSRSGPRAELKNPIPGQPNVLIQDEEDIDEEVVTENIDRPFFEHIVNLRHVMVDPALQVPDVRKAKYVEHRLYMTWKDLDRLRGRPGFDIPSREELLELFLPPKEPVEMAVSETSIRNPLWDARAEARYEETTVDPFNQPLEVLERWDDRSYIVVLQKKVVLCNDANPYGVIPFLSIGWWDVPEAFWSMGLAKTIGSEQRLQQGITNVWLDNATLNLNGIYTRVIGKSVPTQNIRIAPGKIINVENKDDFQAVKRLDPVPEAGQHLSLSQSRVEQVSGASPIASRGDAGGAGHSNLARSAEGARLLGGGSTSVAADFVEKLSTQVIVPFLYHAHEMNRAMLPAKTLKYILSDELQHEFMQGTGDKVVELLNARVKFSILAGAKMQARKNMAQALPIMIQFLTNEQTTQQLSLQQKKVDVAEIFRMMFEVSDWKNYKDVIVDMTPEEIKRNQMNSPAAKVQMQVQAAQQQNQQKFDQKSQLIDQENIARAGREVLRHTLESASTPEEVTGQPGGTGFGANA